MDFNLQEVFSILDENGEGQIQLRRFIDVASNYYSDAEQLARITKALDPKNTGFINFDQFCNGIAQISSLQGVSLKDVASDLTRLSRENSLVEDSDQRSLNQDGSTTTFSEYDVDGEESSQLNNSSRTQSTNNRNNHKNKSPTLIQSSSPNNQSISPRLDSAIFGDEEEFSGIAEPDSGHYSLDSTTRPRAATPQRISEILKRNNHLKPINATEEVEQQLQQSVDDLQKTVEVLTDQKQATTDRLAKIQSENTDLRKRLLALEDRFQDLEGLQSRTTKSEQQKYAQFINQQDRSFLQEKEILQARINAIESELKHTQTANGQMKKDVTQLKQKLDDVDIQLHESQARCNDLAEDNEKLLEQLRLQRKELEQEKLRNSQLADQLTSESSRKLFAHTLSRTEDMIKTSEIRIQELDAQIQALKLENERLRNENEELRERAVVDGINEGRGLMASHGALSYAAELEVLSKDELMSKLREQLVVNDRLRQYIERMLTVIIENSPQLLEITMNGGDYLSSSGASTTSRKELVISTKEVDNKPSPPETLTSTETTNDEPQPPSSLPRKQSNNNS